MNGSLVFYFSGVNPGTSPYYLNAYVTSGATDTSTLTVTNVNTIPFACILSGLNVAGNSYYVGSPETLTVGVYRDPGVSGAGSTTSPGSLIESCSLNLTGAQGVTSTCSSAVKTSMAAGESFYVQVTESNAANSPYVKYGVSLACQ